MLSRFAVTLQCQIRSVSNSVRLLDRFTRDSLRNRLHRQTLKETVKQQAQQSPTPLPYASDMIPVRPSSDLIRALGFSVGIIGVSFTAAAISDYENNKTRIKDIFAKTHEFFKEFGTSGQVYSDVTVRELSPGEKCAISLVAVNCLVTLLWRVKPLQPAMWKWFSNSFASRALCWPMMLSVFSHNSVIHLGLNMYVLFTFAQVAIDKFFGPDHFWAFYLSAGVMSSLVSLAHKSAIRSPIRALGASGAILGLLTYTCCKIPDARLKIVFVPHFDFSAENAVIGIILFDLVGLVLRFKLFDHAAHLGGSIFGVFYALYGEDIVWGMWRERVVKFYRSIKNE